VIAGKAQQLREADGAIVEGILKETMSGHQKVAMGVTFRQTRSLRSLHANTFFLSSDL
jgi:hypothetical protein